MGEKQKKITKEVEKLVCVEIFFMNSVIINEIKRIFDITVKLSKYLENLAVTNGLSVANDLREEIRILSDLIYQLTEIDLKSHNLTQDDVKKILNKKRSYYLHMLFEI